MPHPITCYRPPVIKAQAPLPVPPEGLADHLRRLAENVCDLEQRNEELASIRATLIINFGEGMRHNIYGLAIKDEGSTLSLMIEVLERLTKAYVTPPPPQ